jgi:peptide/nickel transport system ATP-binding protein
VTDPEHHLLEVQDLSVEFQTRYGTVRALRSVNWHVDRGETLAILGESGSGKSVSVAAVMGLIDTPPGFVTAGRILYRGKDLLAATPRERRDVNGRRIAMVFQDPLAALNPVYTVGWQVAEMLRAHGTPAADARARAVALLDRVGIPDPARRADDYPHQFSGGQRQRVMIAMAIALRPDVLIADEPTSALDVTIQAQILKLLKDLQAETGMGLVLISHDLAVVADVADRVVVMTGGEVVETGPVATVFEQPAHPYTRKLLAALPGREPFREPAAERPPLLDVRDLAKHYEIRRSAFSNRPGGVVKALDGVTFTLAEGETLGIVGESGSGKSTLARTILGLERPTGGTVTFRGEPLARYDGPGGKALRRRIQAVFQDPTASLNPRMTVEQIVSEPWAVHPDVLPRPRWRQRVEELLAQVGLDPSHPHPQPHQFSGGQRQRIAIARALALKPDLILCDEAVSALDVSVQAQVIELLKSLQRENGLSYLFIAHDLPVVRDFADRVLVMYRGRIVEQGPTRQIFTAPEHPYTRELLAANLLADRSPMPDVA